MKPPLWQEALGFLFDFQTGTQIEHFYDIHPSEDEELDILDQHKLWNDGIETEECKRDFKTFYRHLIQMILAHDRDKIPPQIQEVGRLDGFQDLTNRLQFSVNSQLFATIEDLKEQVKALQRGLHEVQEFKNVVSNISVTVDQQKVTNIEILNALEHRFDDIENKVLTSEENQDKLMWKVTDIEEELVGNKEKTKAIEDADLFLQASIEDIKKGQDEEKTRVGQRISDLDKMVAIVENEVKKVDKAMENVPSMHEAIYNAKHTLSELEELQSQMKVEIGAVQSNNTMIFMKLDECHLKLDQLEGERSTALDGTKQIETEMAQLRVSADMANKHWEEMHEEAQDIISTVSDLSSKVEELEKNYNEKEINLAESDLTIEKLAKTLSVVESELKDCKQQLQDWTSCILPLTEKEEQTREKLADVFHHLTILKADIETYQSISDSLSVANRTQEEHTVEMSGNILTHEKLLKKLENDWNTFIILFQQHETEFGSTRTKWEDEMEKTGDYLKSTNHKIDANQSMLAEIPNELLEIKSAMEQKLTQQMEESKKDRGVLESNVNKLASQVQNVTLNVLNVEADISTTCERLDQLSDAVESNSERIICLEENQTTQLKQVNLVEGLNNRIHLINEEKQKSEATLHDLMVAKTEHTDLLCKLQDKLQKQIEGVESGTKLRDQEVKLLMLDHDKTLEQNASSIITLIDRISHIEAWTEQNNDLMENMPSKMEKMEREGQEQDQLLKALKDDMIELVQKVDGLQYEDKWADLLSRIDNELYKMKSQGEKNERHVDNLRDLNNKLLEEIQHQVDIELNKYKALSQDIRKSNEQQFLTIEQNISERFEGQVEFFTLEVHKSLDKSDTNQEIIKNIQSLLDDWEHRISIMEGNMNWDEIDSSLRDDMLKIRDDMYTYLEQDFATQESLLRLKTDLFNACDELKANTLSQNIEMIEKQAIICNDLAQSVNVEMQKTNKTLHVSIEESNDQIWTVLLQIQRNMTARLVPTTGDPDAKQHKMGDDKHLLKFHTHAPDTWFLNADSFLRINKIKDDKPKSDRLVFLDATAAKRMTPQIHAAASVQSAKE
eukprot:maker-scaffold47_size466558-snap-gene-3.43 protein:Tk04183 transcript:maker-scaffold47_size466558-snap-gene-3.43-mRNA-1 annotation:"golgin subfamily a member 4 isoform x2"